MSFERISVKKNNIYKEQKWIWENEKIKQKKKKNSARLTLTNN